MIAIPEHPNYYENLERSGNRSGHRPCVVCGKGIKPQNVRHEVRVFWGTTIVTETEARRIIANEGVGGDCSYYPIGTDCLRHHPEMQGYIKEN